MHDLKNGEAVVLFELLCQKGLS